MTVSNGDITGRFPEFAAVTPERLAYAIADATAQVNANAFGAKTDLAIIYLAAHFLASANQGSSGQLQSEKVGDIQRTYSIQQQSQANGLSSTSYGNLFLSLRKQIALPIVT